MRHMTQQGLDLIKHFEGFKSQSYLCPAGYPTIGYGHVIKPQEDFSKGVNKALAEDLLRHDVQLAEQAVLRLIKVPLSNGQFDALVSFTYNLGSGALQRSTLRQKVNQEEHADVPAEFMRWVYAGGYKLPGLVKRRQAEAELYTCG